MKISKVSVKNFRSLSNVQIRDFEDINMVYKT